VKLLNNKKPQLKKVRVFPDVFSDLVPYYPQTGSLSLHKLSQASAGYKKLNFPLVRAGGLGLYSRDF
jgi:hypothetical protein